MYLPVPSPRIRDPWQVCCGGSPAEYPGGQDDVEQGLLTLSPAVLHAHTTIKYSFEVEQHHHAPQVAHGGGMYCVGHALSGLYIITDC
jgi:hypothetical protein